MQRHINVNILRHMYNKMSLLRPPNIKTTSLLRLVFPSPKWYFSYDIIFDIKTTSLIRTLLGSPKGGLNIGILLYIYAMYDGPNGSLTSHVRIPNSGICTTNFGIRNHEVYVMWASGNSLSTLEGILNLQTRTKGSTTLIDILINVFIYPSSVLI